MAEFVKNHGKNCAKDWERLKYFYQLSLKSGLFVFPAPVKTEGELIYYERISDLISLTDFISLENYDKVCAALGRVLAAVHADRRQGRRVSLHGDFGLVNIGWSKERNLPIIFDPIAAEFCWYDNYLGDRYFDLGQLISTIFTTACYYRILKKSQKLPVLLIKQIVQFYENSAGLKIDLKRLEKFAMRLHRLHFRFMLKKRWGSLKFFGLPLTLILRNEMRRAFKCLIIV
ncbi:MAG: hypothetical protein ACOYXC_12410 [Candidatus Rifleibacteriota bacterium]